MWHVSPSLPRLVDGEGLQGLGRRLEVELCEDAGALAGDQGAARVAVILGSGGGAGDGRAQVPGDTVIIILNRPYGQSSAKHSDIMSSCHEVTGLLRRQ